MLTVKKYFAVAAFAGGLFAPQLVRPADALCLFFCGGSSSPVNQTTNTTFTPNWTLSQKADVSQSQAGNNTLGSFRTNMIVSDAPDVRVKQNSGTIVASQSLAVNLNIGHSATSDVRNRIRFVSSGFDPDATSTGTPSAQTTSSDSVTVTPK